jgi:Domain of unknown function (DUF1902)
MEEVPMIDTPNVWTADVVIKFDMDADVFFVAESNIPGLHAESEELDDLLDDLETLIPEQRKANAATTH